MGELDQRIDIDINILDVTVTRVGFGVLAIVHKHQQSGQPRIATFLDLPSLLEVHPANTPVGRFATIAFSQGAVIGGATPDLVKVIKQESAETASQALDAANAIDSDFYGIGGGWGDQTQIESAAAWALANDRFFGYSSGDPSAITETVTDPFAVIKNTSSNRAIGWYSAKTGLEFTIDGIAVSGTVATADITTFVAAHGSNPFAIGDDIGIWTSAIPALNAMWEVVTVGANDFTFTVPTGTSPDVASSDAWQNFNLIEAGAMGKMLPKDAGAATWDIQQLAVVTPDILDGTAQSNLGSKNANWFTNVGGLNITGGSKPTGFGGKMAAGRYADVQRGSDWLKYNTQIDFFELIVGNGGELGFDIDDFQKVQQTAETRLDVGLDNKFLTPFVEGPLQGLDYLVVMPKLSTVDRSLRTLEGIEINAFVRGKIQGIAAKITLST
jgi:hypothetical protein